MALQLHVLLMVSALIQSVTSKRDNIAKESQFSLWLSKL